MADFCDMMKIYLDNGKLENTNNITPHNQANQLIDKEKSTDAHLTKYELMIYEEYGLLPEDVAAIEALLGDTIEKAKPKKMKEKEDDKYLGLSKKVYNYLEKHYKDVNQDGFEYDIERL